MAEKHSYLKKALGNSFDIVSLGKIPPQAIDVEELVLGAIILESEAVYNVIDRIKPEHFYKDAHIEIYTAIYNLFLESKPIDLAILVNQLRKNGKLEFVGGAHYLTGLTSKINSTAHLEEHALILKEKWIKREIIRIGAELNKDGFEDSTDPFDLLSKADEELSGIFYSVTTQAISTSRQILLDAMDQLEAKKNLDLAGIPSGYKYLDKLIGGWQAPDLIIVAARPGMGKSAFMLNLVRHAIESKQPVAIFSLEMSKVQLMNRLISSETELNLDKLNKGEIEEHEFPLLTKNTGALSTDQLLIDDTPALSVVDLKAKVKRLVARQGIKAIFIDYLQLMRAGSGEYVRGRNREQEIAIISQALKALAKEMNIPIIALAQLSRQVETRGGSKIPQLSDLRESGSIEQEADVVIFLYRPGYYKIELDKNGQEYPKGITLVMIEKNRNGATDIINLRFIGRFSKFVEMDEENTFNKTDDLPF